MGKGVIIDNQSTHSYYGEISVDRIHLERHYAERIGPLHTAILSINSGMEPKRCRNLLAR